MTIKTTKWIPDTCGCALEFTWDDSLPQDQITTTLSNVQNKCPAHKNLSNNDVWNTLNEENPRKNFTLQSILDNGPSTLYDIAAGNNRILKSNLNYTWSWSGTAPNRVLNVSLQGINLTNSQKNTIQTVLNNKFGSGKVILL